MDLRPDVLAEQQSFGTEYPGIVKLGNADVNKAVTPQRLDCPTQLKLKPAQRRKIRRARSDSDGGVGRAHHIVDIENLVGVDHEAPFRPWFREHYEAITGFGSNDLMTVAADINHACDLGGVFPRARCLVGVGKDGADEALVNSIDWPSLVRGCETVVIASGDIRFTDVAYRARTFHLRVVVFARAGSLSRFLAPYADEVIEFPALEYGLPTHLTKAA